MRLIKRTKRQIRWGYRAVTSDRRVLPAFLIIGAAKSGTTSLYAYLSQHPNLIRGYSQEVHYFDGGVDPTIDNYSKGERWYRKHFPLRDEMRVGDMTFESSPLYIYSPPVAERIYSLLPNARLIALLRNPTERAISQYFHVRRAGREPLGLAEALAAEETRLQRAVLHTDPRDPAFIRHSYQRRGVYVKQIKRFQKYFPSNQMLIINSEQLFSSTNQVLRRVFEFLGVDPDFQVPELSPRNVGSNRQDVDPKIYRRLDAYFAPHNRQLYDLVGTDFGW